MASELDVSNQPNPDHDVYNNKIIQKYGCNRIDKFLHDNGLEMIIRSHEPVKQGIEKFNNNRVVTIFSNTDYGGTNKNNACLIEIKKSGQIDLKQITGHAANTPPGEEKWHNLEEL